MGKLDIGLRFAHGRTGLNITDGNILMAISSWFLGSDSTILGQVREIKSDKGFLNSINIPFPPGLIIFRFDIFRSTMTGSPVIIAVFSFRSGLVSVSDFISGSSAIGILDNRNLMEELGIVIIVGKIGRRSIVFPSVSIRSIGIGDIFTALSSR